MRLLFVLCLLSGTMGISTYLISRIEQVTLDDAWEILTTKIIQGGKWIWEAVNEAFNGATQETLTENVTMISGFLPRISKTIERYSLIPLESMNVFWGIGHSKWWQMKIRIVCDADKIIMLAAVIEQIIRETLFELGHLNVVIRHWVDKDPKVPNQYIITVEYACSKRDIPLLESAIRRDEEKIIQNVAQEVKDEQLEKELNNA